METKKLRCTIFIEDNKVTMYTKDDDELVGVQKDFTPDNAGIRCLTKTIGKRLSSYFPKKQKIKLV